MKLSIAMALAVVIVAGCAAPSGHITASDTSKLWAGMTKADVIRILGKPASGIAMNGDETMTYLLEGPWEGKPFEIRLLDGVVQTYELIERDPAKANSKVARLKPQVAVPWYSAQDYARILMILPTADRGGFTPYDEWRAGVELEENEIRSTGRIPVRIPVQAIEIESWCRHHGVPFDRAAISAFTEMRLGLQRGPL